MNAELLAMLGGANPAPSRREVEPKTLLSFKAGKMTAERQPDGKFLVTADPRRGTIEVNWIASSSSNSSSSSGQLKIEWRDRRTRAIVDTHAIFPDDDCTYSKVDTGNDKDRVYLLQYGNGSDRRFFFWMQDKEEGNLDEDHCVKINTYIADPAEAAAAANGEESPASKAATATAAGGSGSGDSESKSGDNGGGSSRMDVSGLGGGGLDNAALMQIMQGLNTNTEGGGTNNNDSNNSGATGSSNQVDTLSNILENLGVPQQQSNTSTSSTNAVAATPVSNNTTTAAPAASATSRISGGLTLSDLQGAMAGLATTSPPSSQAMMQQSGPPLSEVVTADTITDSGILDNEEVKQKLIALLPEGQRSEDKLMENLRSPQVKQCLKSLTAALEDNGGGSFNSILANFQLKPEDGAAAMASGNPIQAFLDCVLKSVQREQEDAKKNDETKDDDGDSEMKE